MTPRASFLRTTIAYLPSVLIPAAANFLFVVVFTRLLRPADLGVYFLTVSVVSFSAVVMGNWFQQSVLRFESGNSLEARSESLELHALFFAAVAVASFALLALYAIARALGPRVIPTVHLLVLPLIVIEVCYRTQLAILQAEARAREYSIAAISLSILRYATALVFFYVAGLRNYRALLLGWLFTQGAIVVTLSWRIGHIAAIGRVLGRSSEWWAVQRARAARYTKYGLPMLGYMMASEGRPLLDRTLIALVIGESAVGIFASNYSVGTNVVGLFAMPMLLTAHPVLMAIANREEFREEVFTATNLFLMRIFLIATAMLMIAIAPNSHRIAVVAMGARYVEGYQVITLALLGSILGNFSIYVGKGLELHQKTMYMLASNVVSIGLATVFNIFAIQRWGYLGAAYGYVLASTLYLVLVRTVSRRYIRQPLPYRLGLILSVAVAAAWWIGESSWLDESLLAGIAASLAIAALTLGVLARLGEIDQEFIDFVKSLGVRFRSARLVVSLDE